MFPYINDSRPEYRHEIYGRGFRHKPAPSHDERYLNAALRIPGAVPKTQKSILSTPCKGTSKKVHIDVITGKRKNITVTGPKQDIPWKKGRWFEPKMIPYISEKEDYVHVLVRRTGYLVKALRLDYGFEFIPISFKCPASHNIDLEVSRVEPFSIGDAWHFYLNKR